MSDNPNLGYFQPSRGSITGFDQANLPAGNPNLAVVGWSIENLRAFLENQSDINFPSNEWIQRVEQMIIDHENDMNNPHHTTLAQIVGDIIGEVLGAIVPGTVPSSAPFFSYDAAAGLPIGAVFQGDYTSQNVYRRAEGGWFVDPTNLEDASSTDTTSGPSGLALFSQMTSTTSNNWYAQAGVVFNTTMSDLIDPTINYPFGFKSFHETPGTFMFGVDIPMVQALQTDYTTTFLLKPAADEGKVRIYQPSDPSNYCEVALADGSIQVYADALVASSIKYPDGVVRIAVSFTSSSTSPDNKLRVVHINEGQAGNGTRIGSLGRMIFAIGSPQTTQSTLDQPFLIDKQESGSCPTFDVDLTQLGTPATLSHFIVTMGLNVRPSLPSMTVTDPTVMRFGDLVISRDQTKFKVTLDNVVIFNSFILEGTNKISISYSPTKIIFKDLDNSRVEVTGTFDPIATTDLSFGPFGGYLQYAAIYPQSDDALVVEFLTNA